MHNSEHRVLKIHKLALNSLRKSIKQLRSHMLNPQSLRYHSNPSPISRNNNNNKANPLKDKNQNRQETQRPRSIKIENKVIRQNGARAGRGTGRGRNAVSLDRNVSGKGQQQIPNRSPNINNNANLQIDRSKRMPDIKTRIRVKSESYQRNYQKGNSHVQPTSPAIEAPYAYPRLRHSNSLQSNYQYTARTNSQQSQHSPKGSRHECYQRRNRYTKEQRDRLQSMSQELPIYKNQKLAYISEQQISILRRIPEHLIDKNKIKADITTLVDTFEMLPSNSTCFTRHTSQSLRTLIGLLIFYIGYEIYIKYSEDHEEVYRNSEIILSNFYQIYFALRLKVPLVMLECYLTLIDLSISTQNYETAQKYAQKCLLASLFYNEKYYQQRCIQKLSMCEYYKGNICEATYLHDNNGQVTQDSIRQTRESYNEQQEIDILLHHLYELPRFSIHDLLADYEHRSNSYKTMVVFKSPRIGPEDSFRSKKEQLKLDLRKMEHHLEFKPQAHKIRRQLHRHEALFTVRNVEHVEGEFRLVKRNLTINEENESSQVLRVHQSLNRVKKYSTRGLRHKLATQFVQFLKRIKAKVERLTND